MSDSLSQIRDDEQEASYQMAKEFREKKEKEDTEKEQEILDSLAKIHKSFVSLSRVHKDELNDWVRVLHDLQRIVLVRDSLKKIKI